MTLRRLVAVIGFCFMLMATTVVVHTFFLAWLFGVNHFTIYLDRVDERALELVLLFLGFSFIPVTIYELDQLISDRS